ncbi:MAG TPA: glutamate-5-semialdehyde dehydrogenase, partial [Firmicutes bacterium]|nr:glutamate-5-semialdehyde dehydrogenase [Bacillota bacterium]
MMDILEIGKRAKEAAKSVNIAALDIRNAAILNIASAIDENREYITEQNNIDIENAEKSGMSAAMIDRLRLTGSRLDGMIKSMSKIVMYPNPIGKVESGSTLENGLKIIKTRVPLGVIGIIFESRPNVSVDAAALCIKSGNAVILRGGKEAIHSNIALASIMREAINKAGLPLDTVQMLENTSREEAERMMQLNGYIDVLIPRGGAGLINNVVKNATVPVIETGAGNCHVYVDYNADVDMAVNIINNAKTSRPSVCNAAETLLVHKDIAAAALPKIKAKLDESNVELRGCPETVKLLGGAVVPASDEDYYTE